MKKNIALLILFGSFAATLSAQSVSVNSDGSAANASAMLEIKSTVKGLLIPRMTHLQEANIVSPATGLMVYQTDGTVGMYINNGTPATPNWQLITASSNAWGTTGNSGTVDGTSFIGTTDNIPFNIMVNNQRAGRIDHLLHNVFFGYLADSANNTGTMNTSIGDGALYSNVAGSNATALGTKAMYYANNQSGAFTNSNVALGFEALRGSSNPANNTGNYNTALGYQTLWSNTTGFENTANGFGALYTNTTGSNNTANGVQALYSNTTGFANTALGYKTLWSNTTGVQNTADGLGALYSNTIGYYNTANGFNALYSNVAGRSATAVGTNAMYNANNQSVAFTNYNVAVGYEALKGSFIPANNTGNNNTALGYQTLYSNSTGFENIANGFGALYTNTTGSNNTANGVQALYSNTTGIQNTANGYEALNSNVAGSNATAVGTNAMYYTNNQSGAFTNYNVAIGFEALRGSSNAANNTGNNNTALGYQTLWSNTSGDYNTASGVQTLYLNNTGYQNTANGFRALYTNNTGYNNTANGFEALYYNSSGYENTAHGWQALIFNTGNDNTANGNKALYTNTTGSNNTALGNTADVGSAALTNATALGNGATVSASNKVRIGNANVTVIEGQVAYTFPSDGRFKYDIAESDVKGLDFILKLKPVVYNFDTKKFEEFLTKNMPDNIRKKHIENTDFSISSSIRQSGFVAQEVEKAMKESGYNFNGLHKPENENDNYSIAYSLFTVPLVKSVQEQQLMIEVQQRRIEELEKIVKQLVEKK